MLSPHTQKSSVHESYAIDSKGSLSPLLYFVLAFTLAMSLLLAWTLSLSPSLPTLSLTHPCPIVNEDIIHSFISHIFQNVVGHGLKV